MPAPLLRQVLRAHLAFLGLLIGFVPVEAPGQSTATSGFAPGARDIVNIDFKGTSVGVFPGSLRLLQGNLEVVDKAGVRMLRASSPSDFVINLPEVLPPKFTIELDLIPKACCNPDDLMLEGVISGSRSSVSAQLTWKPSHLMVVGGNPQMFQMDMPEAIYATLPSTLTHVAVSFDNETVTMYTNGKRLYTLTDRKFVRGQLVHVSLGGQDDDKYAVYLARVRVADASTTAVATTTVNAVPATTTAVATTTINAVPATTTGTITPSSGTSGTVARTIKSSAVKCPAVTNFKAVANGANAAVLSWTPMSSSCQTIAETTGEHLSDFYLTRWRTQDSNSCPSDLAGLNTFTVVNYKWSGSQLQYTLSSPTFPLCLMLPSEDPDVTTIDDHSGLEGGERYSYRLWPIFVASCQNGTPNCDWGSMYRAYPYSDVSVVLPLARPLGLSATAALVPPVPAAPTELRAAGWSDMIRLRWAPVAGAVSYRITRVANTGDPETVLYEGPASDFAFSDPYGGGGLLSSGWACDLDSYCEFRDLSVIKGGLYSYRVWALSAPNVISPPSRPVTQRASFAP